MSNLKFAAPNMTLTYKDIIKSKYSNKAVISYGDGTYAGITWNTTDGVAIPTQAQLDAALADANSTSLYLTASYNVITDASGNMVGLELANSGVAPGTYGQVTVDVKGRITAATNPTTLAGYGITDGLKSTGFIYTAVPAATGTTVIPLDGTAPLNTEGTQVASLTMTPASVTSKVRLGMTGVVDASTSRSVQVAIFKGATCVYAISTYISGSARPQPIMIDFVDVPGSVASTTYTVRIGTASAATWYLNQAASSITLGGKLVSTFYLMEIA